MADELVTIYRFRGSSEANLWKEKLEANGIKSVIVHDYDGGAALATNELQVRERDLNRAKKILKPLKKISPIKATRWNLFFLFLFGIIIVIPGVLLLIFPQENSSLPVAIICIVFGGFFILVSFLAMIRRK